MKPMSSKRENVEVERMTLLQTRQNGLVEKTLIFWPIHRRVSDKLLSGCKLCFNGAWWKKIWAVRQRMILHVATCCQAHSVVPRYTYFDCKNYAIWYYLKIQASSSLEVRWPADLSCLLHGLKEEEEWRRERGEMIYIQVAILGWSRTTAWLQTEAWELTLLFGI